jgi:hypothetical protein
MLLAWLKTSSNARISKTRSQWHQTVKSEVVNLSARTTSKAPRMQQQKTTTSEQRSWHQVLKRPRSKSLTRVLAMRPKSQYTAWSARSLSNKPVYTHIHELGDLLTTRTESCGYGDVPPLLLCLYSRMNRGIHIASLSYITFISCIRLIIMYIERCNNTRL